jgi:hypothetical protein
MKVGRLAGWCLTFSRDQAVCTGGVHSGKRRQAIWHGVACKSDVRGTGVFLVYLRVNIARDDEAGPERKTLRERRESGLS